MKWYWWTTFTIFVLLGIFTLVPSPASKPCLLGYYALCSFTPLSTIGCWAIAGGLYWLGRRMARRKQQPAGATL